MAQKDAMEQAKEVLRQIIRYRFWISISVAALFAVIAYFVGSGPVRDKADSETKKIKGAETKVKKYNSPTIPTQAYQPIVEEKTQVLTKDVNTAWKTLFDRQAPLLTWPETVQERFRKWGRKWPENTSPAKDRARDRRLHRGLPSYVAMVYKTFNPFDYETGEGVVVAPPEDALLRPAKFDSRTSSRPRESLGRPGAALDPAHLAGGRGAGQQECQGLGYRHHPTDPVARGRQSRRAGSTIDRQE